MHPALWTLLRLHNRASFRLLWRTAKTVRGAIMLLFLGGLLAVGFGVMIVFEINFASNPEMLENIRKLQPNNPIFHPELSAPYLPLILFAFFLKALFRPNAAMTLCFSPAEVAFLFTGPFARREVLLFRLSRVVPGYVVLAAGLAATPLAWGLGGPMSTFVGLALTMLFLMLVGLASTLARMIVAEAAETRLRRWMLYAIGILVAAALPRTITGTRVFHTANLAWGFRSTWAGRVLLAPFEVFSRAMTAERWFPDLVGWASAAAAIDLALLLLVFKLDADYLEWSAGASASVEEVRDRVRRGGGMTARAPRHRSWIVGAAIPWLGGAGPIGWRQAVGILRLTGGVLHLPVLTLAGLLISNWFVNGRWDTMAVPPGLLVGIVGYTTVLSGAVMPVGFRGDVGHIDFLKSLPIRPLAVAVGEIAGCVAIGSVKQLAVIAVYGLLARSDWGLLTSTAILAPAVNWIVLATGNLIFLLYPTPANPAARSDLFGGGRSIFGFFLQLGLLVPLLGIPASLGAAAYLAGGYSLPAMVAAALATMAIEAVPLTMLTASAFERYDPSIDTPAS